MSLKIKSKKEQLICRTKMKGCGQVIVVVREAYTTEEQRQRGWMKTNHDTSHLTAVHVGEVDEAKHVVLENPTTHQILAHRRKLEEICIARRGNG